MRINRTALWGALTIVAGCSADEVASDAVEVLGSELQSAARRSPESVSARKAELEAWVLEDHR